MRSYGSGGMLGVIYHPLLNMVIVMIDLTPNLKAWLALFVVVVALTVPIYFSADYVISICEGYLTVSGVM